MEVKSRKWRHPLSRSCFLITKNLRQNLKFLMNGIISFQLLSVFRCTWNQSLNFDFSESLVFRKSGENDFDKTLKKIINLLKQLIISVTNYRVFFCFFVSPFCAILVFRSGKKTKLLQKVLAAAYRFVISVLRWCQNTQLVMKFFDAAIHISPNWQTSIIPSRC